MHTLYQAALYLLGLLGLALMLPGFLVMLAADWLLDHAGELTKPYRRFALRMNGIRPHISDY